VVSSTPRPHFTPVKDPVPIVHEAGWAPGFPTSSPELFENNVPAHDMKAYGGRGCRRAPNIFRWVGGEGVGELALKLYIFVVNF